MLNAVLREVRWTGGDEAVHAIFARMSRRQSTQLKVRIGDRPVADRVAAVTDFLRDPALS
jgi:hypothetical protein